MVRILPFIRPGRSFSSLSTQMFLPVDLPSQPIPPKPFRPVVLREFERHLNAPYPSSEFQRKSNFGRIKRKGNNDSECYLLASRTAAHSSAFLDVFPLSLIIRSSSSPYGVILTAVLSCGTVAPSSPGTAFSCSCGPYTYRVCYHSRPQYRRGGPYREVVGVYLWRGCRRKG